MVITGGANVYPREIEEALRGHESVTDIAVIGLPDPEWGERVVAFVVPARETSIREMSTSLDAYCLENMARYKRPKEYHLISDLPRNGAGKVLKTELRRRLLDAPDRR